MGRPLGMLLGAISRSPEGVAALVLAALVAFGLRALALCFLDQRPGALVAGGRAVAGALHLALGGLFGVVAEPLLHESRTGGLVALFTCSLVLAAPLRARRPGEGGGAIAALVVALLVLLSLGSLTLLGATSLLVNEGQTAVLIELTGETRRQIVRWTPPGLSPREEGLPAHRVILRAPGGEMAGEAWIYGDRLWVKGRIRRLSPLGLLELEKVSSGAAGPAPPTAPGAECAVLKQGRHAPHPWWRAGRAWLLTALAGEGEPVTSSDLPLVDAQRLPARATYSLALRGDRLTPE